MHMTHNQPAFFMSSSTQDEAGMHPEVSRSIRTANGSPGVMPPGFPLFVRRETML